MSVHLLFQLPPPEEMLFYIILGFLAICFLIKLYIIFTAAPCMSDTDMTGRTVVITGATAG
jgi:hypothetical protein